MSSSRLPTSLKVLLERDPPPQLTPRGPFDKSLRSEIDGLKTAPAAVRASLHLANDDIDRAHEVAQADEGCETSNLTHAILHRREGDYWNSKWWLRRIDHPLVKELYGSTSAACAFVDKVEGLEKSGKGDMARAELLAQQSRELAAVARYALEHEWK